ncbi:MAG: nucleotidyltransferase family protein [Bacillota bacterium]
MVAKRLSLDYNQQLAINSLKGKLKDKKYPIEEYIIFGSVARGEATEGSDLDLLALTSQPISHRLKHTIYGIDGIVTEINLEYDTNLSLLN